MKASILYDIGDLRYEDIPKPVLRENEVLVNVKAAGICGSDINRVFKTGTYHFPTVIGHEFSGIVVEAPNHPDLYGKRVGVFPLKPCFKCTNCQEENYEMCSNYDYLGSRCNGGFEEYVAVPAWNLIELPDTISYEEAAFLEPTSVAIHALSQPNEVRNRVVAIIGPGTIGNILCQIARLLNAKSIIMIGRTQRKLDNTLKLGANYTINSVTQDVKTSIMEITNNLGADIVIEGTGACESLSLAIEITRSGGEIVLMGNPLDNMNLTKTVYWQILRRQLKLCGTWNSSFSEKKNDWKTALSYMETGKLDLRSLISHRLPFNSLKEGLNIMRSADIISNKIMLINNENAG